MGELPPIIEACVKGDEGALAALLKAGVSVEHAPDCSVSPLFAAACEGHTRCVAMLLEVPGIKVDDGDSEGRSPLYAACVNGHRECARLLAQNGASIATGGGPEGGGALHAACMADEPNIVATIFQMLSPGDVERLQDVRDAQGRTALHIAVASRSLGCVELLLANKADVNATDSKGMTALHVACWVGADDCAKCLVESAHAAPDARDRAGRTPLACAAINGNALLVRLLLEHGGDPALPDVAGKTPAQHARAHGHVFCAELLEGRTHDFSFLSQVRALSDFQARDASEMTIHTGDVVNVLWKDESGWWMGECGNHSGLFPGNYCEPVYVHDRAEDGSEKRRARNANSPRWLRDGYGHLRALTGNSEGTKELLQAHTGGTKFDTQEVPSVDDIKGKQLLTSKRDSER